MVEILYSVTRFISYGLISSLEFIYFFIIIFLINEHNYTRQSLVSDFLKLCNKSCLQKRELNETKFVWVEKEGGRG